MQGKPSPLLSSFRLSYYTLLNLLRRIEGTQHDMEFVIANSFQQFQFERSLPEVGRGYILAKSRDSDVMKALLGRCCCWDRKQCRVPICLHWGRQQCRALALTTAHVHVLRRRCNGKSTSWRRRRTRLQTSAGRQQQSTTDCDRSAIEHLNSFDFRSLCSCCSMRLYSSLNGVLHILLFDTAGYPGAGSGDSARDAAP